MRADPFTFVCFKWGEKYEADHVNMMLSMLSRHVSIDFELVCITDQPDGILPEVRLLPMWHVDGLPAGGCWKRLPVFSETMRMALADRFMCLDLDCVVVGDLAPLCARSEDFIISAYQGKRAKRAQQLYNGSMMLMTAGARSHVWEEFDPGRHPELVALRDDRVGTDQAWIREALGPKEARFTTDDGVYEARNIGDTLPANARIVFFSGPRSPATSSAPWVLSNYH